MSISSTQEKFWLAFYTKAQQEFKTALYFQSAEIEHYLPAIVTLKQWCDRKMKVTVPLFKSYIFAKVNEKERLTILQQKTVITNVSFSGKPSQIPEWQIESIKKMLSETPDILVTNGLDVGQQVKIIEGSFSGVVGTIKIVNKEKWISVSLDLLNRTVSARLPIESVIKFVEN
ncbi:MAG: NusG antitermination factor [Ignavibacteria bacterium]|nr:MAG: NusG antitermination factor [Ignavibacteria bacterium]KAF0158874.1 MAG: NusG antitermination factor [Ignavibacteria bacterium]